MHFELRRLRLGDAVLFRHHDFDETPGPGMGREAPGDERDRRTRYLGVAPAEARAAAEATVASIAIDPRLRELGHLATWYARSTRATSGRRLAFRPEEREARDAQARRQTNLQVLESLTDLVDDRGACRGPAARRSRSRDAAGRPIDEAVDLFLRSYVSSLPADDGCCSSATGRRRRAYGRGRRKRGDSLLVIFLEGRPDDPLFLQLKEAEPSVLALRWQVAFRARRKARRRRTALDPGRTGHFPGLGELGRRSVLRASAPRHVGRHRHRA